MTLNDHAGHKPSLGKRSHMLVAERRAKRLPRGGDVMETDHRWTAWEQRIRVLLMVPLICRFVFHWSDSDCRFSRFTWPADGFVPRLNATPSRSHKHTATESAGFSRVQPQSKLRLKELKQGNRLHLLSLKSASTYTIMKGRCQFLFDLNEGSSLENGKKYEKHVHHPTAGRFLDSDQKRITDSLAQRLFFHQISVINIEAGQKAELPWWTWFRLFKADLVKADASCGDALQTVGNKKRSSCSPSKTCWMWFLSAGTYWSQL